MAGFRRCLKGLPRVLNIPLEGLAGEDTDYVPNPLDETIALALESANGIDLEYGTRKEAEASRFRFYRRIRQLKAAGVKSVSVLALGLNGSTVTLARLPTPIVKVRS